MANFASKFKESYKLKKKKKRQFRTGIWQNKTPFHVENIQQAKNGREFS